MPSYTDDQFCNKTVSAQQANPAIDRQKLAEAIASIDDSQKRGAMRGYVLEQVIDAARKHLETLPKPMWRITGTLPSGRPAARYETADPEAALDFARGYLGQGITHVSVRQVYP